jgi:hypothetical protein
MLNRYYEADGTYQFKRRTIKAFKAIMTITILLLLASAVLHYTGV